MTTDAPGDSTPIGEAGVLAASFVPPAPERGRVGVEWELLPLDERGRMVPFGGAAGVEALLGNAPLGGTLVMEEGRITGLHLPGGGAVALEPGGQVEIVTPPSVRLESLYRYMARTYETLDETARDLGFRLVPWAHAPYNSPEDLPDVPKARYRFLEKHFKTAGRRGRAMMKLTASTQVALDFRDEEEMGRMARVLPALLPYLVAYLANGPVAGGRRTRRLSQRPWIWRGTDPERCGLPAFLFSEAPTYAHWARYGLTRRLLFLVREGSYLGGDGRAFGEWLKEPGPAGPLTLGDWTLHQSTLFPEIRNRGYLEVRTADSVPLPLVMALAALLKGLLCGLSPPGPACVDLPAPGPGRVGRELLAAARLGPRWLPPEGPPPRVVMEGLLSEASGGLAALGESDEWLTPLRDLVEAGFCPAMLWRRDPKGGWTGPGEDPPVY